MVDLLCDGLDLLPQRQRVFVEVAKVRRNLLDDIDDFFGELPATLGSVFLDGALDDVDPEVGALFHRHRDFCLRVP